MQLNRVIWPPLHTVLSVKFIYMNKTFFKVQCILLCMMGTGHLSAQNIGAKTNFAHWATFGTINGGLEFALSRKTTLEVGGGYNCFTFKENKKFKHWLVEPELRYWTCESFNGHFFGLHAIAGEFNVGGFNLPVGRLSRIKDYRYEGYTFGVGLSYGHHWVLAPRWNFELNLGVGYAYLMYDKFNCVKCGEKLASDQKEHYLGITKAAISLIYFIK